MAVDLHVHTNASSDGEFTAREILEMARKQGLEAIAIIDHDTVEAVEEGLRWGERLGIEVIPATEITADHWGKYLHILGYYIDYKNAALLDLFSAVYREKLNGVDRQLEKIRNAGFFINKGDVMSLCNNRIPLPSIYARAMFEDSRNNGNPILDKFRGLDKYLLKFCVEYLIPGRALYAPEYIPEAKKIIDTILTAGGVPILAHPGATLTQDDNWVIEDLLEMGIAGLEVYTNWHNEEQEKFYYDFCRRKNLLITCGSDFHGRMKPEIQLGSVKNNSYQVVLELREFWQKRFDNRLNDGRK